MDREPQHLVVMGVAGSGKSTVATLLAERLDWRFAEADEFHPQANIDKMSAGVPLTDDDRWPWLEAMRDWLTSQADAGRSTVVTCSALKRAYRLFFNSDLNLSQALDRARSDLPPLPEVERFLAFVESSERGVPA